MHKDDGPDPAVSIHASSREDATVKILITMLTSSFNPRVLAGGRDYFLCNPSRFLQVSIHASSREDATLLRLLIRLMPSFNPRVLAGGRDFKTGIRRKIVTSFNPRVLAGGRDFAILTDYHEDKVSIHASSREDATRQNLHQQSRSGRFNPRVLAGGRDV